MSDIIIAPFSNSPIRDWPSEHFAELIGILLPRVAPSTHIRLVGTANQGLAAAEIVRYYPPDRVINACGRMTWPAVLAAVRGAECVIGNNSGVPHVAGYLGTPTVCIFGGSQQRLEWRPRGDNVVVLSRAIVCSPCQLDHHGVSPFGKACLREITPQTVADAVLMVIGRAARNASPTELPRDAYA